MQKILTVVNIYIRHFEHKYEQQHKSTRVIYLCDHTQVNYKRTMSDV